MADIFEIITINKGDSLYPKVLVQIPDAPDQIFVMGNPHVLDSLALAIVGTRKPTDYGIQAAAYFTRSLAKNLTIISGLAYGIDTVALTEALITGGLPPIAVIGSGLDSESFYPKANWNLAIKIVKAGGAVISEYPPGTPPLKHHFPARNRIIAGLSRGVLVIEAGQHSGALITADLALDYNREVFALAGSIFVPQAKGVNQLIKTGAGMITSPADVLRELNIEPQQMQLSSDVSIKPDSPLESQIINLIADKTLSIDDITKKLRLDSAVVSSTLTLMEVKGMIKSTKTGKFVKSY